MSFLNRSIFSELTSQIAVSYEDDVIMIPQVSVSAMTDSLCKNDNAPEC